MITAGLSPKLQAYQGMNQMVEFGEGDRLAETKLGESFEVSLGENPTTGFRWKMLADGEPVCRLVADQFQPGVKPGEPGVHRWQFQAAQAGAAEIRMILQRPWAKTTEPAKCFSLRVRVKP